jgi:hypothetical protein
LYSLICQYAKVGLIPSQQAEDGEVSNFQLELPNSRLKRASRLKSKLESSRFDKFFLLFVTMLGTFMVIGDGVLTPCISGLFGFVCLPLMHGSLQFTNMIFTIILERLKKEKERVYGLFIIDILPIINSKQYF